MGKRGENGRTRSYLVEVSRSCDREITVLSANTKQQGTVTSTRVEILTVYRSVQQVR